MITWRVTDHPKPRKDLDGVLVLMVFAHSGAVLVAGTQQIEYATIANMGSLAPLLSFHEWKSNSSIGEREAIAFTKKPVGPGKYLNKKSTFLIELEPTTFSAQEIQPDTAYQPPSQPNQQCDNA